MGVLQATVTELARLRWAAAGFPVFFGSRHVSTNSLYMSIYIYMSIELYIYIILYIQYVIYCTSNADADAVCIHIQPRTDFPRV